MSEYAMTVDCPHCDAPNGQDPNHEPRVFC
jgi:endogenous inhibitor of DNA gyrase (YacG/DUF329 family)